MCRDTLQRHVKTHESGDDSLPAAAAETEHQSTRRDGIPIVVPSSDEPVAPRNEETFMLDAFAPLDTAMFEYPDSSLFQLPETFDWEGLDHLLEPSAPHPAVSQRPVLPRQASLQSRASRPQQQSSRWFSRVTPYLSPSTNLADLASQSLPEAALDEQYRDVVQAQLETAATAATVPSSVFMNHCVRLYIDKCLPWLPFVHLPTFQSSESNALLVYAIASLGSQLIGTSEAAMYGQRMFEGLNRSIMTSWMTLLAGSHEPVAVLQAVIIGQTFALLSAEPMHLVTAQAFHGALVFCLEKVKVEIERKVHDEPTNNDETAAQKWRSWTIQQTVARMGNALRIQDAEIALFYHRLPQVQSGVTVISRLDDQKFFAPDLQSWHQLESMQEGYGEMTNDTGHSSAVTSTQTQNAVTNTFSPFFTYAQLADILARVAEHRLGRQTGRNMDEVGAELANWLASTSTWIMLPVFRSLHLLPMWSAGWLFDLCDINGLEVCGGRDGEAAISAISPRIEEWASSAVVPRVLIHCFKIQQQLENVTLAETPPMHVPRVAYQAGLVLIGIATYANNESFPLVYESQRIRPDRDIHALAEAGFLTQSDWRALEHGYSRAAQLRERACAIIASLRRLGPWALNQALAETLEGCLKLKSKVVDM